MALTWVAGAFLIPVMEHAGHGGPTAAVAGALRLAYAPLCHQEPDRSLWIGGRPLAVCARCAGLYLGGVAGLLAVALSFLRRPPRPVILWIAAAPTLLDFVSGQLGGPSLANLPRLLVAVPPGLILGAFLAEAVTDLERRESPATIGGGGSVGRDPAGIPAMPQAAQPLPSASHD